MNTSFNSNEIAERMANFDFASLFAQPEKPKFQPVRISVKSFSIYRKDLGGKVTVEIVILQEREKGFFDIEAIAYNINEGYDFAFMNECSSTLEAAKIHAQEMIEHLSQFK